MRTGVLGPSLARSPLSAAPLVASLFLALSAPAFARAPETSPPSQPELPAPTDFVAKDRPGDSGNAILLTWKDPSALPEDARVQIRRAQPPAYDWRDINVVAPGGQRYVEIGRAHV